MKVLGISAFYHDSAAALLIDGVPVAAAQEERFSRIKNDAAFPSRSVEECLRLGGLSSSDLDAVVFYDKPLVKFERLLHTSLARAPRGYSNFRLAMPTWLREKLWIPRVLHKEVPGAAEYLFASHHHSHAASAYYPSPFERAAVLTIDGVGEWATCSFGVGDGACLELREEQQFPHSVGLLYSAFTAYLGFRVNEGEYKVMGLAPYGAPRYMEQILETLLKRNADGSFALATEYFSFLDQATMTNSRFDALFGGSARRPDAPLTQRHMDIAASIQQATEILVLALANYVAKKTGEKKLCLAGGVALNCVANARLVEEGPFEEVWIQPAAGDAGGALGAAYIGYSALGGTLPAKQGRDLMSGSLLGPVFSEEEMAQALSAEGLSFVRLDRQALLEKTVDYLARGKIVGWYQGRMEFGPRALGNRSILADPRVVNMQQILNQKIKFREGFRPFAPSVLQEHAAQFFDSKVASPYMLLTSRVSKGQLLPLEDDLTGLDQLQIPRSTIPAVTHVDNSARLQTVDAETNHLYHALLERFFIKTDCPVLVNTSFNVKDEPIVCRPQDALNCYQASGIDALALGPFWVQKNGEDG